MLCIFAASPIHLAEAKIAQYLDEVPLFACFLDFMPKLDGQYLFRDYETTLQYVKIACDNTAREEAPLYALWLLSEKVEDLASLLEGDLSMGELGVDLDEHIAFVIQAMSSIADRLGLAGVQESAPLA